MATAAARRANAEQVNGAATQAPPAAVSAKTAKALETTKARSQKSLVDILKTLPSEWHKMTEKQQQQAIDRCGELAGMIVNDCATTMATQAFPAFAVTVGKITIDPKTGLKADIGLPSAQDVLDALLKNRVNGMMLVAVDAKRFMSGGTVPRPDVVGDLKIPKAAGHKEKPEGDDAPPTAPEKEPERHDEAALAAVGRGADGKEEPADQKTGELPPHPAIGETTAATEGTKTY